MSAMIIGRLKDLMRARGGSEWILSLTTKTDFSEAYDELSDCDVQIDIRKARKHRSLTANAFAWVLLDQIAERTGKKVTDVYRDEIRELGGVSTVVGMKTDAIPVFQKIWETGHLGRQVEVIPGSVKEGWSNVKIYFGSSEFDSAQMSRFINNIVQDAETLGIPTMPDKEVERLLGAWATRKQKETEREREKKENGKQEERAGSND